MWTPFPNYIFFQWKQTSNFKAISFSGKDEPAQLLLVLEICTLLLRKLALLPSPPPFYFDWHVFSIEADAELLNPPSGSKLQQLSSPR